MNVVLYIMIFIMGTLFGSFYSLAVYRIPKRIDIVKTHSFCPNCNHKLGFFELIPIFSYLILGGKCKECKQKIRPRYLILEVLSGITLVLIALALKIDIYNFNVQTIINFAFIILYLVAIFLIAGIDKENRVIEKNVLYYAIGISVIYIIYLCIIDSSSIYRYVMYLSLLVILLIVDTLNLKNKAKNIYAIGLLLLIVIMEIFTSEMVVYFTGCVTLLIIAGKMLIYKIKAGLNKNKKEHKEISKNLKLGYYLCISNILVFITMLFIANI